MVTKVCHCGKQPLAGLTAGGRQSCQADGSAHADATSQQAQVAMQALQPRIRHTRHTSPCRTSACTLRERAAARRQPTPDRRHLAAGAPNQHIEWPCQRCSHVYTHVMTTGRPRNILSSISATNGLGQDVAAAAGCERKLPAHTASSLLQADRALASPTLSHHVSLLSASLSLPSQAEPARLGGVHNTCIQSAGRGPHDLHRVGLPLQPRGRKSRHPRLHPSLNTVTARPSFAMPTSNTHHTRAHPHTQRGQGCCCFSTVLGPGGVCSPSCLYWSVQYTRVPHSTKQQQRCRSAEAAARCARGHWRGPRGGSGAQSHTALQGIRSLLNCALLHPRTPLPQCLYGVCANCCCPPAPRAITHHGMLSSCCSSCAPTSPPDLAASMPPSSRPTCCCKANSPPNKSRLLLLQGCCSVAATNLAIGRAVAGGQHAGAGAADQTLEQVAAGDLLQGAAGAVGVAGVALVEVVAGAVGHAAGGEQVEHAGGHLQAQGGQPTR